MITAADVIKVVCLHFELSEAAFVNGRAGTKLARQIAAYVCFEYANTTANQVYAALGYADHSGPVYAKRAIATAIENDKSLKALVSSLVQTIEFKAQLDKVNGTDVRALAQKIARQPSRGAIAASTMDVAALAYSWLDLFEVAHAGQYLSKAILTKIPERPTMAEERIALIHELAKAIDDEMTMICTQEER